MERFQKMFFKYVSSKLARRVVSATLLKPARQLNIVDWNGNKLEGLIASYVPNPSMGYDHPYLVNSTVYYDCLPSVAMHHNSNKSRVNLSTSIVNSSATGRMEEECKPKSVVKLPPKQTELMKTSGTEKREVKSLPYRLKFNMDQLASFQATMQATKRAKRIKLEPDSKVSKSPELVEPKIFGCTAPNCPNRPKGKKEKGPQSNQMAKDCSMLWVPVPRFAETVEALVEKNALKVIQAAIPSPVNTQITSKESPKPSKPTNDSEDMIKKESAYSYFENACLYPDDCEEYPWKALKSDPQENDYTLSTFMSMPNRFSKDDLSSDNNCIPDRYLSMPYSHLSTDRRPCSNDSDPMVAPSPTDAAVTCLNDTMVSHDYLDAFGGNDIVDPYDELLTPLKVWSYPKEFISTFNVEKKKSGKAFVEKKLSRYEHYFRR